MIVGNGLVVDDLLVRPLLVNVDLEVVSGDHSQALGDELLPVDVDLDSRLLSLGVLRDAGEKVSHDQLVDFGLVT